MKLAVCGCSWSSRDPNYPDTEFSLDSKFKLDLINEMIASKESYFLEVMIEKEDNVFPMVPTGASVSDVRLS